MKVVAYELFKLPPRWLFLKLTTDEGLVGWCEPLVEGRADTTLAAQQANRYAVIMAAQAAGENHARNSTSNTKVAGARCLHEAGRRCLRITATFQNPYWKYWRNGS